MNKVEVKLVDRSYPIYIKSNILGQIGEICQHHHIGNPIVVITDSNVSILYGDQVIKNLQNYGYEVLKLVIEPGELSKSIQTTDWLYEKMISAGADRKTTILALGGGVVGDLAGFIAATYMRGIPFVQIPTTLLAQTDSSVGGKVGINHRLGKNLIGAFYQPKFVLIDPSVLLTLDKREIFSGLGEIIKYSLIGDNNLFKKISHNLERFINLDDFKFLEQIIKICCQIKAKVVSLDEKEAGLRRILNFGHTIGHALEAATDYGFYRHGEAVILGMKAMSWLSNQEKLISEQDFSKINSLLSQIPVLKIPAQITQKQILNKINHDKKRSSSRLAVVLLKSIGSAHIIENIDEKKLKLTVEYLLETGQEKG